MFLLWNINYQKSMYDNWELMPPLKQFLRSQTFTVMHKKKYETLAYTA